VPKSDLKQKTGASVVPDIKESLGSPRPVPRQDSPEPGPSNARRSSQDDLPSGSGSDLMRSDSQGSSHDLQRSGQGHRSQDDLETPKSRPRERPVYTDVVAKSIDQLFALMAKIDGEKK